jgi:hypothetical protein
MCDQCLCKPELIGHPVHGWKLIKAHASGVWSICAGDFGLINEEQDQDVNIVIPAKVMPKLPGMTWTEYQERTDRDSETGLMVAVCDFAEAFRHSAPMDDLADLVVDATEDGFDPDRDGYFSWWLYKQIADLRARWS